MDQKKMGVYTEAEADSGFVRMLDRGIDDMEADRELPIKDIVNILPVFVCCGGQVQHGREYTGGR